jgi:hypothetical protein
MEFGIRSLAEKSHVPTTGAGFGLLGLKFSTIHVTLKLEELFFSEKMTTTMASRQNNRRH